VYDLSSKVALVTGAGAGIGRAIAEELANSGARVVVVDKNGERARAAATAIGADRAEAVEADVTRWDDNRRAVEQAVRRFGRLDILVGNAGVFDGFLPLPQIDENTLESLFERLFAVNVKGYLLGARAALPELQKTRGNMVFTASTAGFYTNQGGIIYTMAKHAVVGLIRELAYELAPHIRVNGVAPGGTFTDLRNAINLGQQYGDAQSLFDAPGLDQFIKQSTPLNRVNEPQDHARVVAFLASEAARGITGAIIPSDGGYGVRGATQAAGSLGQ
jgi:NAD(P)-dependent dehydrogenase (short-subunit alcohol dehydrogenase family)